MKEHRAKDESRQTMVLAEQATQAGDSPDDSALTRLAAAAVEGDERAFAGLYQHLSQRIFNLVLRSVHDRPTAEDLCQEIWFKAHREIACLREPEAVRAWLYRIASRACVDFSRSSLGRHRDEEDEIGDFVAARGPQPEDAAILGSEVGLVWETLAAMAPRQSVALYLKQVEGLSYADIASVLDCETPTVEALLFRARQSFTRAYHRVESSQAERCELFSQVMASMVDREPTQIQRSALDAHSEACKNCRTQLKAVRRANKAYLSLPMLPVGKGLALEALLSGGGAATGTGIFSTAAGILGAGGFQAKLIVAGIILVTAGAVATGNLPVPEITALPGSETTEIAAASTDLPENSPVSRDATVVQSAGSVLDSVSDVLGRPDGSSGSLGTGNAGAPAGTTATSAPGPTEEPDQASIATRAPGQPESMTADGSPDIATQGTGPPAGSGAPQSGPPPDQGGAGTQAAAGSSGDPPGTATTEQGLAGSLLDTTGNVTTLAGETVEDLAVLAGDTVDHVVEPVVDLVQPVDQAVEDLTGLSVGETLQDVTGILPGSGSTPVPLDETLQDVVEPVVDLLEDPLQPVEDLTDPLLEPLLGTPDPGPQATPPPEETSEPANPPPATESPCLLGPLLC